MMAAIRQMSRREVLVVGAGPAGLVTACELARHGVPVRLIDRLPGPDPATRAVGVHGRTQELLNSLGVIGRLNALGRQIATVEARDEHGLTLARIDLSGLPSRFRYLLDVTQPQVESVLRQRAAELGVSIEWGVELTELRQDAVAVDVTLSSAQGERQGLFGFVVGADGEHSTVRRLLGVRLPTDPASEHFVMADADLDGDLRPDTVVLIASPDGVAGAFPLSADRVRLLFAAPGQPGVEWGVEQLRHLCADRFGGRLRLRSVDWLGSYDAHHGQVSQYQFGRTFLAGDAAHVHGPAGGQSMNGGMQDAFNLAWKLGLVARGKAHASLLRSYEAERYPVAARDIDNAGDHSTIVGAALGSDAVRRLALAAAGHVGPRDGVWTGGLAELTVSYADSPAVGRHGVGVDVDAPAPGTHVPPLAELPDGPGHTVLLRCADPMKPAALQDVLGSLGTVKSIMDVRTMRPTAADDAVAAHYGIGSDGFVAIRPDGYIGYVAQPASTKALRTYLHDHLRAI
jgi:2-polyprenyl-6-methoxyphenol hydroxylase-like FAD-dependent oxidoreductase